MSSEEEVEDHHHSLEQSPITVSVGSSGCPFLGSMSLNDPVPGIDENELPVDHHHPGGRMMLEEMSVISDEHNDLEQPTAPSIAENSEDIEDLESGDRDTNSDGIESPSQQHLPNSSNADFEMQLSDENQQQLAEPAKASNNQRGGMKMSSSEYQKQRVSFKQELDEQQDSFREQTRKRSSSSSQDILEEPLFLDETDYSEELQSAPKRPSLRSSLNRRVSVKDLLANDSKISYKDYLAAQREINEVEKEIISDGMIDLEEGGKDETSHNNESGRNLDQRVHEEKSSDSKSEDGSAADDIGDLPSAIPNKRGDLSEMKNIYKSMKIMSARTNDPRQSAVFSSLCHDLTHKIKKLDHDGHFTIETENEKGAERAPWYSPPIQRHRWGDSQNILPHVNWGDLFFDLFYVAAAYNLGIMLISSLNAQDYLRGIIYFVGIFGSLFITWETEVFYASRYAVMDYSHRLFEVIRFIFVANAVINIQPIGELSDTFNEPTSFYLTLAILLESLMHLGLNVELYYKAQGDRVAIQIHTARKIKHQLLPTSFVYFIAVVAAGVMYWVPRDGKPDSLLVVNDLPLLIVFFGYFANLTATTLRKLKTTNGSLGDVRKTFVPNDVDYVIQRYGEWTMLMIGEAVMALVETTESERNYQVAAFGSMTLIVLHALNTESAPRKADGHALWRNIRNGTCFALLMQLLSIGLILVGVAYKIFVSEDSYGVDDEISVGLYMGSLALVLMCLELMIVTHRGTSKTLKRVYKPSTLTEDREINWGLALIVIFKLLCCSFLCVFPMFSTNTTVALFTGLAVIVSLAMTRILGWGLVYHEQEMKDYVTKVAAPITNTVSAVSKKVSGVTNVVTSTVGVSFAGLSSRDSSGSLDMSGRGLKASGRRFRQRISGVGSRSSGGRLNRENSTSFNSDSAGDLESQGSASAFAGDSAASLMSPVSKRSFNSKNSRHNMVYDEMFDAVVIADLLGIIITVNQMALDIFGYEKKSDLIGENISILVGGGDAVHHDEYIRNFNRRGKTDSNIGKQRILFAKRKDGTEFQAIIGIRRRGRQLVGYIRDMSEMTAGTSQSPLVIANLGTIDSRVQRVLDDSSFDCIAVSDMQGVIQGVNQTLVNDFGYNLKEELVGQKLQMIIGGSDSIRQQHDGYLEKFGTKTKQERNESTVLGQQRILLARRKDGTEFQCIIGVHMIEGTELLVGFIRNLDKLVKT